MLIVKLGAAYLNLDALVRARFRADDRTRRLTASVETLAPWPTGGPADGNPLIFEGREAEKLRQLLEGLAANGGDDPGPPHAA